MKKKPAGGPRSSVRRRLTELGHRPRRSLGQHFLADPGIARRIVGLADISRDECVVEIGPGLGALTEMLAEASSDVRLIEYDSKLAAELRTRFAKTDSVRVIEADVLEVDWRRLLNDRQGVVVANLPYNIATAVLTRMLDQRRLFSRLVVMVQLEVAERLAAVPGSKAYGVLGVLTQVVATVRRGFRVAPEAFVPRPEVDSEVVVIEPSPELRAPIDDLAAFKRLVRTAFNQRRKQLVNSLRPLCKDPAALLRSAGIDAKRRPETLTLDEIALLSNQLGSE